MNPYTVKCAFVVCLLTVSASGAQNHQGTPQQRPQQAPDLAAVAKGRAMFKSSCSFCHGNDATGSRAPDLLRSPVTLRDDNGNTLGPVIRNGRPDKGMPSFSTLKDDDMAAIVAFLHFQANSALHSASVPGNYPVSKLLTGNAAQGKTFFEGTGGCSGCHSPTGDLAGVAKKYSAVDLQQAFVYPSGKHIHKTATVTLPDGTKFEGKLVREDEFNIGIMSQDGWYRSWAQDQVKVDIHDPLEAHRELMGKYSDSDIHNLFAYLESLK